MGRVDFARIRHISAIFDHISPVLGVFWPVLACFGVSRAFSRIGGSVIKRA